MMIFYPKRFASGITTKPLNPTLSLIYGEAYSHVEHFKPHGTQAFRVEERIYDDAMHSRQTLNN